MLDKLKINKKNFPTVIIILGLLLSVAAFFGYSIIDPKGKYPELHMFYFVFCLFLLVAGIIAYIVVHKDSLAIYKKILLGIAAAVVFCPAVLLLLLWIWLGGIQDLYRYKYNDDWIIGRNITEVEGRYGNAEHKNGTSAYGYFLYYENFGLDPRFIDIYYAMFVDENGTVIEVDDWYTFPELGLCEQKIRQAKKFIIDGKIIE